MTLLSAVLCLACVIALLVAELRRAPTLRAVSKTAASALFLVTAWSAGVLDVGAVGVAVMVALVLSAVGDIALLGESRAPFLAGLIAFLLGHVAYVVAFALLGVAPLGVALGAVAVIVGGASIWRWLGPHVGSMRGPVIAYVVVISTMVAMAVGSALAGPPAQSLARGGLLLAAALFYTSDLCVARQRFVVPDVRNRLIGLPLYYVAQLLFAVFAGMLA